MKLEMLKYRLFSRRAKQAQKFKVLRTWEGTAFEIACGLVVVATWVLVGLSFWLHAGRIDKVPLLMCLAMDTFLIPLFLFLVYKPQCYNIPQNTTIRQFRYTVRFVRVVILLLAITFLILTLQSGGWVQSSIPNIVVVALIILVAIVYKVLFYFVK